MRAAAVTSTQDKEKEKEKARKKGRKYEEHRTTKRGKQGK